MECSLYGVLLFFQVSSYSLFFCSCLFLMALYLVCICSIAILQNYTRHFHPGPSISLSLWPLTFFFFNISPLFPLFSHPSSSSLLIFLSAYSSYSFCLSLNVILTSSSRAADSPTASLSSCQIWEIKQEGMVRGRTEGMEGWIDRGSPSSTLHV